MTKTNETNFLPNQIEFPAYTETSTLTYAETPQETKSDMWTQLLIKAAFAAGIAFLSVLLTGLKEYVDEDEA